MHCDRVINIIQVICIVEEPYKIMHMVKSYGGISSNNMN